MKTAFVIAISALGLAQVFAGPGRAAPPRMAAPHLPAISHPQVELQPRVTPESRVETDPRLDESRRNREMEATHERVWAARPQPAQERLQQPEVRREEAQRQQQQQQEVARQQETLQQQTAQQRLSFAEARERMSHERHDRAWWEQHHNGIFRGGTGYYFLDAGYWYPAFGYDPAVDTYASSDPMYAIADLTPDQEIETVQTALQEEGYYTGSITGSLDTMTLDAIAKFQTANGLLATGAIDQPTLEAMGLS